MAVPLSTAIVRFRIVDADVISVYLSVVKIAAVDLSRGEPNTWSPVDATMRSFPLITLNTPTGQGDVTLQANVY